MNVKKEQLSIKSIKKLDESKMVYDIEVADDHHYILENGVISHNSGPIFAASQVIGLTKLKLKEDDQGRKTTNVTGIRSKVKVVKSRFSKPFESVEIKIPYETGMDPHSGLFDLFEKKGLFTKGAKKYSYFDKEGNEHKYFEREMKINQDGILDLIMKEWDESKVSIIDAENGETEEND